MKKLFIVIGLIPGLLVITSIQGFADEDVIYGCVGKTSGILRVVDDLSECRLSENAIYWNVVGPQGPPGPQGEQGEQGAPGEGAVKVYNAENQFLGFLLDKHSNVGQVDIFIPNLNLMATLGQSGGYFESGWLYYESDDCTGTPYARGTNLKFTMDELFLIGNFTSCGERLFTLTSFRGEEKIMESYGCPDKCIQHQTTGPMILVNEIPRDQILFDLPVALPLRYECQSE